MQKIVLLLFLFIAGMKSFAQQQYFMYLQADDQNPFYARINNKMYSSSETGYMIIPKLGDSSFDVTIGFPRNAFPEQRFPINVNKKDKGFQLKNVGDSKWALVNLQTMAVIENTAETKKIENAFSGVKKTDAFSELLANVVNDSAVLYTPVKLNTVAAAEPAKAPQIKKAITQPADSAITRTELPVESVSNQFAEKEDSAKSLTSTAVTNPAKQTDSASVVVNPATSVPTAIKETNQQSDSTVKLNPVTEKPFISRLEERKTARLYEATYLELYTLTTDTIRITIELEDNAVGALQEAPAKSPEIVAGQKDSTADKVLTTIATTDSAVTPKKVLVITNSDCKSFATDHDVDKFRIRLLDDKTIDDKMSSAKKYFRNKCYSVSQVKALSELFPSDETKYRFFELAYPYVSDTSNFNSLEEMIQANLYKTQFRTMINK